MGLTMTSAPSVEPVTTAEAKAHMRIDHSSDDTLIGNLVTAARENAEHHTRRALISQTWQLKLDAWPVDGIFYIPKAPLQSVSSITYVDDDGATQTVSASNYDVDTSSKPGRIIPAYDEAWPTARATTNSITVTFVAGYGDATTDVPEQLRIAIMMLTSQWYENREATVIGTIVATLPFSVESLFKLHEIPEVL